MKMSMYAEKYRNFADFLTNNFSASSFFYYFGASFFFLRWRRFFKKLNFWLKGATFWLKRANLGHFCSEKRQNGVFVNTFFL